MRRVLLLSALLGALGAAGCGDDEESGDKTSTPAAQTTATASPRPAEAEDPVVFAPSLPAARRRAEGARVKRAVTNFIAANNARDASLCTRLVTLSSLKAATGTSGPAALKACRKQASTNKTKSRLVRIERIELRPRANGVFVAAAQYVVNVDGTQARTILIFRGERGRYLVDGARPAPQPGQAPSQPGLAP